MRRSFLTIAIIVVLILVIGGIILANHNNNKSSSGTNTPAASNNSAGSSNAANSGGTPQSSTSNSPNSQSPADTANSISISNFAFNPDSTTIKAGTKVTWTNNDTVTHTVTETDGQAGPGSGDLAPGSTYSFTFTKAGTYRYHCSIHPEMTGTVTVTS